MSINNREAFVSRLRSAIATETLPLNDLLRERGAVAELVKASGLTFTDFQELDDHPGAVPGGYDGDWHSALRRARNGGRDLFDALDEVAAWRNRLGFFGLGSLRRDQAVHYILKLQQGRLDREALDNPPASLDDRIPPLDLAGGVIRIPKSERTVAALVRMLAEEWPSGNVYVPEKDGTWGKDPGPRYTGFDQDDEDYEDTDDDRTYSSQDAARLALRITEAFEAGKDS